MTIRSMVGLIPLFAVETLDPELLERLPAFKRRLEWFIDNRPDLTSSCGCMRTPGQEGRRILAILDQEKLRRVMALLLDETEFLSAYGIRSLSRVHKRQAVRARGRRQRASRRLRARRIVQRPVRRKLELARAHLASPQLPARSSRSRNFISTGETTVNVELPTGSGRFVSLAEAAAEISRRLVRIFLRDATGRRPVFGRYEKMQRDPHFRDFVPFHEYFHGDDGSGVGASHQTGWTGLVAKLIQQSGE